MKIPWIAYTWDKIMSMHWCDLCVGCLSSQSFKCFYSCSFLCRFLMNVCGVLHPYGSKQHLMNQYVYFEFMTIVLFEVLLPKKTIFHKEEFQMIFLKIIYLFNL